MMMGNYLRAFIAMAIAAMVGMGGLSAWTSLGDDDAGNVPDVSVPDLPVDHDDNVSVPDVPDIMDDEDDAATPDEDDANTTDPTPVDDPKTVPSVTLTGSGDGVTKDFMLYEGVTVLHVSVEQGEGDELSLSIADGGTTEMLVDPHVSKFMGSYQGDIVIGVRGEKGTYDNAYQNIGMHHLEVKSNGTWSIVVEQPRSVGTALPLSTSSEDGKYSYAYSINVPAGTPTVRFTLHYDGPENSSGIYVWMVKDDGTEMGAILGSGYDHDVDTAEDMSFGHCYGEGDEAWCEPEPGTYWIEVHTDGQGSEWTLSAKLV